MTGSQKHTDPNFAVKEMSRNIFIYTKNQLSNLNSQGKSGFLRGTDNRFYGGSARNLLQLRNTVHFQRSSFYTSLWPLRSIYGCNGAIKNGPVVTVNRKTGKQDAHLKSDGPERYTIKSNMKNVLSKPYSCARNCSMDPLRNKIYLSHGFDGNNNRILSFPFPRFPSPIS